MLQNYTVKFILYSIVYTFRVKVWVFQIKWWVCRSRTYKLDEIFPYLSLICVRSGQSLSILSVQTITKALMWRSHCYQSYSNKNHKSAFNMRIDNQTDTQFEAFTSPIWRIIWYLTLNHSTILMSNSSRRNLSFLPWKFSW